MPCPSNALGQPLCNVVEHPDRLDESFCSTCNRRFKKATSTQFEPPSTSSTERRLSPAVTDIIIGLLALILTAFINSVIRSPEPQSPPPPIHQSQLNERV